MESARREIPVHAADAAQYSEALARIVALYRQRIERYAAGDGGDRSAANADSIERELRLVGLQAERDAILELGRHNGIKELTLRKIVREIDLQEARYSA
jgi:CPA1 family monovalent cation:H+ antiporter